MLIKEFIERQLLSLVFTLLLRVRAGGKGTFMLYGNLTGKIDVHFRPVTNGDGAFSSMIEVAEQKLFTTFFSADQTLEAGNLGVAVFGIGAACI